MSLSSEEGGSCGESSSPSQVPTQYVLKKLKNELLWERVERLQSPVRLCPVPACPLVSCMTLIHSVYATKIAIVKVLSDHRLLNKASWVHLIHGPSSNS